jgi:hypothetical protein
VRFSLPRNFQLHTHCCPVSFLIVLPCNRHRHACQAATLPVAFRRLLPSEPPLPQAALPPGADRPTGGPPVLIAPLHERSWPSGTVL